MRVLQVTIGSGTNTPIYTLSAGKHDPPIYAQSITFQNNGAAAIRFGDSTTSSTKGIQLAATSAPYTINCPLEYASQLTEWYVAGTPGGLVDILVL